jgi:hypothetical protein
MAIGDFFAVAKSSSATVLGYSYPYLPNPGTHITGIVKATENNSPIPQDRVFLDYTYYHNVPFTGEGIGVVRMTPGIERTTLDGLMSVEVRMPVAETLDNHFTDGGTPGGDVWQAGNLYVAPKMLLYGDSTTAIAAGMGISTPTGSDLFLDGTDISVENRAVHLLPYLGALVTNETFFTQAYIQLDVDVNGNPILDDGDTIGRLHAQNLLYIDDIFGAWLWTDPNSSTLNAVAGALELHYTTSINETSGFEEGASSYSAGDPDLEFLTGILGVHFMYAGGARVTFGYGVPLADDQFADGEFRMMLNWGPPFGALSALGG